MSAQLVMLSRGLSRRAFCAKAVAETSYKSTSRSESERELPHEFQLPFRPSGNIAWAWKKNLQGNPKRYNAYCGMIRRISVEEALTQMRFARTDKAAVLYNLVLAAKTNAINDWKMNPDYLVVDEVLCGSGPIYLRVYRGGRGRHHIRRVRHSNICVKVKEAMPMFGRLGRWSGLLKQNKHGNYDTSALNWGHDRIRYTWTFRKRMMVKAM